MKYKKFYKYIHKLLEQTNYLKIRPYAYMERTINDIALEYLEDINCFLKRIKKFKIFLCKVRHTGYTLLQMSFNEY